MAITELELISATNEHRNARVKTWHNGRFGLWYWDQLTQEEQRKHEAAQKRAEYVALFNPNGEIV